MSLSWSLSLGPALLVLVALAFRCGALATRLTRRMRNAIDCLRLSLPAKPNAVPLQVEKRYSQKVGHASNMLIIAQAAKRDKLDDVGPRRSTPRAVEF